MDNEKRLESLTTEKTEFKREIGVLAESALSEVS